MPATTVITGGQDGRLHRSEPARGNDTVTLGRHDRRFSEPGLSGRGALTAADHIDGSAGFDISILNGDYTGAHAVVFDATTMVDIDNLVLTTGSSYDLTTNDGNVSAGQG